MQYNYVFFDGPLQYNRIARFEAEKLSNFLSIENNGNLNSNNRVLNHIYKLYSSERVNSIIPLPQFIWNKKYLEKVHFNDNKPICFLFGSLSKKYIDMKLFSYIRKHYPNCKIVLLLRDVVNVCLSKTHLSDVDSLKEIFDVIYSIDEYSVQKYDFKPINVMCSRYPVKKPKDSKKSDVVFVGKAKDRMDTLNEIYTKLTSQGIVCDFTILKDGKAVDAAPGIKVIDTYMNYEEMLQRTVNSRCILEITQKGISSKSSRFLEALCYNKKLITDVAEISDSKFYNPNYIRIIQSANDINIDFIMSRINVNYGYDGEYSPIKMIEKIDDDLTDESRIGDKLNVQNILQI